VGSRRYGYHLVHYLGHAVQDGLILEDRYGRSSLVRTPSVNALLRLNPNLRLVLFAGCQTARAPEDSTPGAADWRERLSLADQCVRDSCPLVIGMQALLPFRTEWLFTRFFYQAVTSGYSVVEAVRLARLAIRDDEWVGGDRLDWAVPSLVVGAGEPGAIVDPSARVDAPVRRLPPREELKLDLVEADLEFFSRLVPLRLAVDVLTGSTLDRVLVVTGPAGVGKTLLVDRALEDIGERVDFVLYIRAGRIMPPELGPDPDPNAETSGLLPLCEFVAELLSRRDGKVRELPEGWNARRWWDNRLVQDLIAQKFVIVVDDVDTLSEQEDIAAALSALLGRRSRTRLALAGNDLPAWLLDAATMERAAFVRLTPFTWEEVWRWIRRNHPVLVGFGKAGLAVHYPRLGSHLEQWGRVAAAVATSMGTPDLSAIIDKVAPQQVPTPISAVSAPRGKRPLRVANAGPFLRGPTEFAIGLTSYAAQHRVGGRTLLSADDTSSALAILLPVTSPFTETGTTTEEAVISWLAEVERLDADVVVLDYGGDTASDAHLAAVRRMAGSSLVIAPAGNSGHRLAYPARDPSVLAVGAITSEPKIADYSSREPRRMKPELFALETLGGTALEGWVSDPTAETVGTSFATHHVAAAAILVWATRPEAEPAWVRKVLQETATELPSRYKHYKPRALNTLGALDRAREDVILDTLRSSGKLSLPELLAGVGLPPILVDAALRRLVARDAIRETRAATGSETYVMTDRMPPPEPPLA
jgi:Subtilase family/CHAT domain